MLKNTECVISYKVAGAQVKLGNYGVKDGKFKTFSNPKYSPSVVRRHLSEEAVSFMTSDESCPGNIPVHIWRKMSPMRRLLVHADTLASGDRGYLGKVSVKLIS